MKNTTKSSATAVQSPVKTLGAVVLVTVGFACSALVCQAAGKQSTAKPAAATPASAPGEAKADAVENSTVKIFSLARYPDLTKPWTKRAPVEITGSGVVLEGKRILCNAHVVRYATEVQVQASQGGDKISATVEAVAEGIDLAVLKLDDEAFFSSHLPLARASALPEIRDAVMAYGYPEGGTSLSITKGIVSRIEFSHYSSGVNGLQIQIDAAINPGNSGGPAMVGDKMIGLVFRRLRNADNIGYIIPNEEIELFLEDVADGTYHGKPTLFDELQTLENPALRSFLKLGKQVEGLVVHRPDCSDTGYPLKKWDVITRIGDTAIDNRGQIKLPGTNLRVGFRYLLQKLASNEVVSLSVVRAGKEFPIQLPVSFTRPTVFSGLDGAYPSYFVYGPLVFSSAVTDLVGGLASIEHGGEWMNMLSALGSPLVRRMGDKPAFNAERLVIVSSPFFPTKLTKGYDNPVSRVVKIVNGVPIKNLGHLVEVLRDAREEFITIEFDIRLAETLVFRRAEMLAATDEILIDNGVRTQGSADTLALWKAKPQEVASHE